MVNYNTFTFRLDSPDGMAYIQIMELKPGEVEKIIMHIGKAGSSVNAWCQALAETVTLLIKKGTSTSDIVASLQGISSSKPKRVKGGFDIKSGPEALAVALIKYRAASEPYVSYDDTYRPAKFTNQRKAG